MSELWDLWGNRGTCGGLVETYADLLGLVWTCRGRMGTYGDLWGLLETCEHLCGLCSAQRMLVPGLRALKICYNSVFLVVSECARLSERIWSKKLKKHDFSPIMVKNTLILSVVNVVPGLDNVKV